MILNAYADAQQRMGYLLGFPETGQCVLVDPRREHNAQVREDLAMHGLKKPLVLWTRQRAAPRTNPRGPVQVWTEASEGSSQAVVLGTQRFELKPGGVGLDVELFGSRKPGEFGFLQLSHLPCSLRVLPVPEAGGVAYLVGDLLFTGLSLLADRRGQGTPERLLELPGKTRIHAGRALLGEYATTAEQERQRALGRLSLEAR